jgi:3-oxoadipate enol-lactonase
LGQTKGPAYDYTMQDYAEDAKALLDYIGWDKCHYMGVSFGGMVGQEFAIRYPERLDRVVWCCTSSGGAGGASYPLHKHLDDTLEQKARRQLTNADLRHDLAWQAANAAEFQTMLDTLMEGLRIGSDDPELVAGQNRQVMARAGLDTYDRLPSIHLPLLICAGKYDGIAPISNQHALQKQVAGARLEFFEGGHGFLAEDPRAFEVITAFLSRTENG